MVAIALRASDTGCISPAAFDWPADEDPLRFPRGPIPTALVRALLAGRNEASLDRSAGRRAVTFAPPQEGETLTPLLCGLALDVVLVLLDLLQRGGGAAPVNPRMILARKGYRRWGCERHAFEQKVLGQVCMLQRLHLETDGYSGPLLQFLARNVARTDYMVRAAPALAAELQRNDWTELPISMLRLDHRQNRGADVLAKKLALVVAWANGPEACSGRDLLTRAGHSPFAGGGRRNYVADQLAPALRRLRSLGVLEVEGLDVLEHLKASRRNWLSAHVRLRLRPPGECAAEPDRPAPLAEAQDLEAPPMAAGARRGRPRFEASPEQRALVRTLHAGGATRQRIAQAVGVSLPTLRCYFATEFRNAPTSAAEERDAVA